MQTKTWRWKLGIRGQPITGRRGVLPAVTERTLKPPIVWRILGPERLLLRGSCTRDDGDAPTTFWFDHRRRDLRQLSHRRAARSGRHGLGVSRTARRARPAGG